MRHLDDIEARAEAEDTALAQTPPALRLALTEWPLVSAPLAEELTGGSRTAVQHYVASMEAHGLIRESRAVSDVARLELMVLSGNVSRQATGAPRHP
jgi:hypothetical protein